MVEGVWTFGFGIQAFSCGVRGLGSGIQHFVVLVSGQLSVYLVQSMHAKVLVLHMLP